MMSGKIDDTLLKRLIEAGVDSSDARLELEAMTSSASDAAELESFVARRIAGEPCAYIVGYRHFYKECYKVTPAVLIPRSDTEILVETVAAACGCNDLPTGKIASVPRIDTTDKIDILDLCTGSGCVGISLTNELISHGLGVKTYLTDVSRDALDIAEHNASACGRDPEAFVVMKLDALSGGIGKVFDIITANPPYIDPAAMGELPSQVDKWEPHLALAGGDDGLVFYRAIASNFISALKPGGMIAVEHGYDQGQAVREIWLEAGLTDVDTIEDYGGNPRVTYGYKR